MNGILAYKNHNLPFFRTILALILIAGMCSPSVAQAAARTYFMYFNTGTVLTQPAVTTNTTCPAAADTNLAVSGIGLMVDVKDATCVPAINRDVIWASATQTLALYYNGTGYASATNVTGTSVGVRVRSQSATATLTVKLFYTTSGNVKVYFTGTPATQAVTSTRTDFTIVLAGLSATNVPAGSKIGVEFSWNDPSGMRLSVNQSSNSDKLIVDETALTYQYENCAGVATAYPWRDISATGTTVALADDATSAAINLGFTFSYGGTNYTQLRIGSNGWLFFGGTATTFTNTALPSAVDTVVMPFWDDLNPASVASRIRYQTLGTAPNRIFVVSYLDVPHYCTGATGCTSSQTNAPIRYTFQAQFRETSNEVVFSYQTMGTLGGAFTIGTFTDTGATIGVEVNNTNYTQFSYNTNSITNNSAIRFFSSSATPICGAGPDHIRVQHDGNGLTCTPETLTVIACANAACTAPNYTASAVTGNVTWTGAPGGSVPFNITVGGTTTVSLPVTTVQTVTLGTSAVSPAPLNPSDCWNTTTATASCSLPFADSGLLVSAPNHVSETVQNITISAVRKANNALNCVPAFANVSRAVNLKCAYANPITGTLPARVAGSALNTTNNANAACDATGQSLSLSFNASGTAATTLQYADVGQMSLNATYTGSAGTGDVGLVMTGSGSFIAAPASFAFSAITAAPIKAGTNFNATVTVRNAAATPVAAPNFGKETAPEGVTLSFSKYQPTGAGAVNGIFSGSVGAFSNGVATATNLNWSEVGTIDLTATLTSGSYLGSGFTATGTTGTTGAVGRFIPDHFDTAIINGCMGCGFTYSGQPFTVTVTAKNGLVTPTTTVNYDGTASTSPNFAKAVTLSAWDAVTGATQNPGPGSLLPPSNIAVALTAFSQGMASLNTAVTMPFYTFTTVPTIPTIIRVRAVDTDNVTSLRVPLLSSTEGQPEIRSGRIKISNAHGSELLQLPIAVTAQYWNALSNYVTSTTDSSSSFVVVTPPATSAVNFGNYQKNLTTVSVVGSPKTVTFSSGVGGFNLAAPGAGNNGSVDMSIPALTGASCYVVPIPLGCYLPSNTARATFGVYKGGNEFIYLRENY